MRRKRSSKSGEVWLSIFSNAINWLSWISNERDVRCDVDETRHLETGIIRFFLPKCYLIFFIFILIFSLFLILWVFFVVLGLSFPDHPSYTYPLEFCDAPSPFAGSLYSSRAINYSYFYLLCCVLIWTTIQAPRRLQIDVSYVVALLLASLLPAY
jgi:hypothetical protein